MDQQRQWFSEPLSYLPWPSLTLVVYAALGAASGAALAVVLAALLRGRDGNGFATATWLGPLAAGGLMVVVTGLRDDGAMAGLPELLSVVLITLGGLLALRDRLGKTSFGTWLAVVLGVLVGAIVFFSAADQVSVAEGWWLIPAGAYIGSVVMAAALGWGAYGLVMWMDARLGARVGGNAFSYGLVAVLSAPILVLAAMGAFQLGGSSHGHAAIGQGHAAVAAGHRSRPNVILISVDTLRPDFVGYNGGPARTPNLDALAERSYIFDNAYSVAPWTRPSFASLFSSMYPSEMGVARARGYTGFGTNTIPYEWLEKPHLLAELLHSAGYDTSAVVTNANLTGSANADQGFDDFYHCSHFEGTSRASMLAVRRMLEGLWSPRPRKEAYLALERAERVCSAARRSILSARQRPLLFWVHCMDPHQPYDPPTLPDDRKALVRDLGATAGGRSDASPMERDRFVAAYTAEIEYWDRWFRQVVTALDQQDLLDESVIIVWSDHGEEFWEHGGWEHGHTLFDEVVKVPMLIHLPGQSVSRRVSDSVSLLDVAPTILDLCDVPLSEDMRGRSLVPLMQPDEAEVGPMSVFLEGCCYGGIRKGLLRDHHKLIYDVYQDQFSLYDLEADPGEQHNIYAMPQARGNIAEMERDLRQWTEQSLAMMEAHVAEGGAADVSPEIRQQLKDMGYIQ
ncbi:MAG: sulfatase [Armatimonadota bacterium]|nr:sulfatase [Armatimonadota bacterium]